MTPDRPPSRLKPLFLSLLLIGAARFAYALNASPAGWTSPTYMDVVYDRQSPAVGRAIDEGAEERRWGPLFFLSMRAARAAVPNPRALAAIERGVLIGLYAWTIALLMRLFTRLELPWLRQDGESRRWLLLFLCWQSTAAIYAISNGMGEIVSAFCIVAHFCYFVQRRFLIAALIICAGVYFKLYPVVFLFPYAVFAAVSRDHRRYIGCLAASTAVMAVVSLPVSGWAFGALYPLSMFRSVMTQPSLIPLRSKEVFGLLFFVTRALTSFNVQDVDPATASIGRTLASAFSGLLLLSTGACALLLRRREPRWSAHRGGRPLDLLVFQCVIGFLMVSFSPDVSITLLLPLIVSLYAPLWIWRGSKAVATWGLFVTGSVLCGNLVPLSALFTILPFGWLDGLAGNATGDLLPHEKFMWYQVPMIGVYCLAAAFGLALTTVPGEGEEV